MSEQDFFTSHINLNLGFFWNFDLDVVPQRYLNSVK